YLGEAAGNDFFLAGGTSLKALMFLKEVEKIMNKPISIQAFFKAPTFERLHKYSQQDAPEPIWEIQKGDQGHAWYFPPIFGLGFIFNTYPITRGHRAIAFNYPGALGVGGGPERIEELASYLIKTYERSHVVPPTIDRIVGYSMGGVVAYEIIKLLVKRGVHVQDFIVWDKPAQLRYAPNFEQDLHPALMEFTHKLAQDAQHKEEIVAYLKQHQAMIEAYVQHGSIPVNITLYACQEGFDEKAMADWATLTTGTFQKIRLTAGITHYEIPEIWGDFS
ncbi:MAG: hypothetical protein EBS17_07595, partial [Flavobacteriia bacterium]|nr:hypothetical protein [Flavobacteriia bacterium]